MNVKRKKLVNRTISLPKQVDDALQELAKRRAAQNMEPMNVSATLKDLILEAWQRTQTAAT